MGFSCTIKSNGKDITAFEKGPIHHKLLDLGPNGGSATDAPYRVSDFRDVVSNCVYGDRLKEAAQDAFRQMQAMAKANLDSLKEEKHCETCVCELKETKPEWWDAESLKALLAIDPKTITYMHGGY